MYQLLSGDGKVHALSDKAGCSSKGIKVASPQFVSCSGSVSQASTASTTSSARSSLAERSNFPNMESMRPPTSPRFVRKGMVVPQSSSFEGPKSILSERRVGNVNKMIKSTPHMKVSKEFTPNSSNIGRTTTTSGSPIPEKGSLGRKVKTTSRSVRKSSSPVPQQRHRSGSKSPRRERQAKKKTKTSTAGRSKRCVTPTRNTEKRRQTPQRIHSEVTVVASNVRR